nr:hypothetical protein [Tanacetum cinerariifolium]
SLYATEELPSLSCGGVMSLEVYNEQEKDKIDVAIKLLYMAIVDIVALITKMIMRFRAAKDALDADAE